jgi:hypothetical protein
MAGFGGVGQIAEPANGRDTLARHDYSVVPLPHAETSRTLEEFGTRALIAGPVHVHIEQQDAARLLPIEAPDENLVAGGFDHHRDAVQLPAALVESAQDP